MTGTPLTTPSVAYLGPAGTFTEAAMLKLAELGAFGSGEVRPLPVATPAQVVDLVRTGEADFACLAIESSVDGPVAQAFDALAAGGVQIYHETTLPIAFSIMTRPDMQLSQVKTLSCHPVGYQQIKQWAAKHLPGADFVPASSNAAAAQQVAEGLVDAAAAPARAADLWGLARRADGVADLEAAQTRFVAVGRRGVPTPRTGNDRTSVTFTLPNRPGTLGRALDEFAHRGVDLCRIESRPTREVFGTYHFYVDLVGHIDDTPIAEALRALWLHSERLMFLGSWPSSDPVREGSTFDEDRLGQAAAWVADARSGGAV